MQSVQLALWGCQPASDTTRSFLITTKIVMIMMIKTLLMVVIMMGAGSNISVKKQQNNQLLPANYTTRSFLITTKMMIVLCKALKNAEKQKSWICNPTCYSYSIWVTFCWQKLHWAEVNYYGMLGSCSCSKWWLLSILSVIPVSFNSIRGLSYFASS